LASAKRRLRSFLDQINELLTSSFPHSDARDALNAIQSRFRIRLSGLNLPEAIDPVIVDQACIQARLEVERYTAILGFILRSTNTRNAFELQFPLKRLVREVIAEDAKLLMSSEWDFVPFTYPMTLDLLPNFVLVGAPAPESNNVLITPLAGHEIGHSAWRKHAVKTDVETPLVQALVGALQAATPVAEAVKTALQQQQRSPADFLQRCLKLGLRQLEEIFCDMFGLYLFGPSFLFAFDYFMAPGGQGRAEDYPSDTDRVGYLQTGANTLGFADDAAIFIRWLDASPVPGPSASALALTDAAVRTMVPTVTARAFDLLAQAGVKPPNNLAVDRVLAAFDRQEPDGGGATLGEIITAGWRYVHREGGLTEDSRNEQYQMLGELMLKSVEVSEFRLRVGDA
jgi:hypothetical protein